MYIFAHKSGILVYVHAQALASAHKRPSTQVYVSARNDSWTHNYTQHSCHSHSFVKLPMSSVVGNYRNTVYSEVNGLQVGM